MKVLFWDFPGGAVVKNLPASAGGHRSDPRSGKIPHAAEQLSPRTTTTEPACHNYWSLCATTTEARAPRTHAPQQEATAMRSPRTATKSSPRSPQLEKARAQQLRPNAAKIK